MASSSSDYLKKNVAYFLDCPICEEPMHGHIWQCQEGHVLCSDCKPKVKDRCPTCRGKLGNIRNRILEKLAEELTFECKYHNWGCSEVLLNHSKKKHEDNCKHRPYNCPLNFSGDPCSVLSGDVDKLVAHLKDDHAASEINDEKIKQAIESPYQSGVCQVAVYNCHSQRYCVIVSIEPWRELFHVHTNVIFLGQEGGEEHADLQVCTGDSHLRRCGRARSVRTPLVSNSDFIFLMRNLQRPYNIVGTISPKPQR